MNTSTSARRVDLQDSRRLPPATSRRLELWHAETCATLSEGWSGLSASPIQVTLGAVQPCRPAAALQQIPEASLGVLFQLGAEHWSALCVLDSPLLASLLADVLGSDVPDDCDIRSLTPLQTALLDLLLNPLRTSLADGWPGPQPLPCVIQELVRPRRCRCLSQWDEVVLVRWQIACRLHNGDCLWLAPRRELEAELAQLTHGEVREGDVTAHWTALAPQLPLELAVELGTASVSAQALADLRPGDVLLLDQLLQRPLRARVGGEPLWDVAPCRVGSRQAVEIRALAQN